MTAIHREFGAHGFEAEAAVRLPQVFVAPFDAALLADAAEVELARHERHTRGATEPDQNVYVITFTDRVPPYRAGEAAGFADAASAWHYVRDGVAQWASEPVPPAPPMPPLSPGESHQEKFTQRVKIRFVQDGFSILDGAQYAAGRTATLAGWFARAAINGGFAIEIEKHASPADAVTATALWT